MSPTGDLPTMSASNYRNDTYAGGQLLGGAHAGVLANQAAQQSNMQINEGALNQLFAAMDAADRRVPTKPITKPKETLMPARRKRSRTAPSIWKP